LPVKTYSTYVSRVCWKNHLLHRLVVALAAFLIASPALAEVADKEPSVGSLWAWALGFNVIALLLEVVRPRLGLLMIPVAALSGWAGHMELSDPQVGPAILSELGPSYVNLSYASFALGLLGPLLVVLLTNAVRRRKA
jgi:hypothetical protein